LSKPHRQHKLTEEREEEEEDVRAGEVMAVLEGVAYRSQYLKLRAPPHLQVTELLDRSTIYFTLTYN